MDPRHSFLNNASSEKKIKKKETKNNDNNNLKSTVRIPNGVASRSLGQVKFTLILDLEERQLTASDRGVKENRLTV